MDMSKIFKRAHALTRAVIQKGDNYQATFGACLQDIIAEVKKMPVAVKFFCHKRTLNDWKGLRAYIDNSKPSVMNAFEDHGISFGKMYIDLKTNEFVFEDLRTYGSFELAKKLGVRGTAKFEGDANAMCELAVRIAKNWLAANSK